MPVYRFDFDFDFLPACVLCVCVCVWAVSKSWNPPQVDNVWSSGALFNSPAIPWNSAN
jgi:hypothetical protein